MPCYTYYCKSCEEQFELTHSMSEQIRDCNHCNEQDTLERIPSTFFTVNKEAPRDLPVGGVVENFIKDAKEDLKKEKKNIKKRSIKK